jgi:hypothetical protein
MKDALILTQIADYCYINLGIEAALDSMETYAYAWPKGLTNVGLAATLRLTTTYASLHDSTKILSSIDTLKVRFSEVYDCYDTVKCDLAYADILFWIKKDTVGAINYLIDLNSSIPNDIQVLNSLYRITGDTTYTMVDSLLDKRRSENAEEVVPYGIQLDVYPNPFSVTGYLAVEKDYPSNITVSLYDELGRHLCTLFQGFMGSGIKNLKFDASRYPSGIIYCVVYDARNQVTKIVTKK